MGAAMNQSSLSSYTTVQTALRVAIAAAVRAENAAFEFAEGDLTCECCGTSEARCVVIMGADNPPARILAACMPCTQSLDADVRKIAA